jgi:hypothetical protein
MSHPLREASLNLLLKLKDSSHCVTEILGQSHMNTIFETIRRLMLGFSNCSCPRHRSIYHMLLNHHRLTPMLIAVVHFLNPGILRSGTPSKFPWSSDLQTTRGFYYFITRLPSLSFIQVVIDILYSYFSLLLLLLYILVVYSGCCRSLHPFARFHCLFSRF